MKCNIHEYVAIFADMEGASTSKKRRKEVRQGKESYTRNKTQLFNYHCSKGNTTEMMMDCW